MACQLFFPYALELIFSLFSLILKSYGFLHFKIIWPSIYSTRLSCCSDMETTLSKLCNGHKDNWGALQLLCSSVFVWLAPFCLLKSGIHLRSDTVCAEGWPRNNQFSTVYPSMETLKGVCIKQLRNMPNGGWTDWCPLGTLLWRCLRKSKFKQLMKVLLKSCGTDSTLHY